MVETPLPMSISEGHQPFFNNSNRVKKEGPGLDDLNALADERDRLRLEEREILDHIRETRTKLAKLRVELQGLRKNRDDLNETVRALKKDRNELRDSAKNKVAKLRQLRKDGVETRHGVQAEHEMAQLEWQAQTAPLEREEEKHLMARIKQLETKVDSYRKIQALSSTVDKEREDADNLHAKIQELAQASQSHHEEIVVLSERFRELKEKLDEQTSKLTEVRGRVREVTQKYFSTMTVTKQADKISQLQKERAHRDNLKESAKKKLGQGEKLSLQELNALYGDENEANKEE